MKIKIGRPLEGALERARVARDAAGAGVELMVDGNGAYTPKEARALAARLEELGVCYFEEPVSSDDLEGLRRVRDGTTRLCMFEGAPVVADGNLTCDWRRPGLGLELRADEAARFAA